MRVGWIRGGGVWLISALAGAALAGCVLMDRTPTTVVWTLEDVRALKLVDVVVEPGSFMDRAALKVEIDPALQARILEGSAATRTSLALVPGDFRDGTIEVEVAAEPNGRGGPDARGFAGLAFRVSEDATTYEAIYLRMTNGRLVQPAPPAPRIDRAIQYVSHPEWTFERFRETAPGAYERGANIAPRRWTRLRIEVEGMTARAYVDDQPTAVLTVLDLRRGGDATGAVGLFVDSGTTAWFRELKVRRAD